jgi:hypothetical protein
MRRWSQRQTGFIIYAERSVEVGGAVLIRLAARFLALGCINRNISLKRK